MTEQRQPESSARAPHPPLVAYYRDAEERPAFVRGLFDRTARHYGRVNALTSLGTGGRYRREVLEEVGLRPGARVLDVAVGTGLVAREERRLLAGRGLVVGLDVSAGMLAEARRSGAADLLVLGRAEVLPFAEASFDFLSVGYALRHFADLVPTFREFRRVLRPGGRLVVLELARPEGRVGRALLRLYLGRVVPLLSRLVTGSGEAGRLMRYYWDTIEACAPPAAILAAMRSAGVGEPRSEVRFGALRTYTGRRD